MKTIFITGASSGLGKAAAKLFQNRMDYLAGNVRIPKEDWYCVVIIAGFVLHISMGEWIAIVLCIALVIAAELINTAIEKLADVIDLKPNKDIGLVKDMAAGAVLWCAMGAVCIGLLILSQYVLCLWRKFNHWRRSYLLKMFVPFAQNQFTS